MSQGETAISNLNNTETKLRALGTAGSSLEDKKRRWAVVSRGGYKFLHSDRRGGASCNSRAFLMQTQVSCVLFYWIPPSPRNGKMNSFGGHGEALTVL